jgi:hypothetical protein
MLSSWRQRAAPIIARVLAETSGQPEGDVRAALLAAYPFGPRKHHPYRIWLNEIRVQTGQRRPTSRAHKFQGRTPAPADERQGALFA